MRLLVCGGRRYDDAVRAFNALNKAHAKRPITLLIEGGATGADALARAWAQKHGIEVKTFPAKWREHGRAAGPMRNQAMLTYGLPDAVLALPGGRGTANMMELAERAGLPIWCPYTQPNHSRIERAP